MPESIFQAALESCCLCPRHCGINRSIGMKGYCRAGIDARVALAALHYWEEPCISGASGSGTVFFSGCNMACVYCQNAEISQNDRGTNVTPGELSQIFISLQERGAHNLNLVTPTPHIPQIAEALFAAKDSGLVVPVVYNTSSYETPEALSMLSGLVDVYLPDLKYCSDTLACRYSDAPDYFLHATRSIEEMFGQTGPCEFDNDGLLKSGVLIRHLLLPGFLADSKRILEYISKTYGDAVWFSLMNQYTPRFKTDAFPELHLPPSDDEYDELIDFAVDLGLKNGFMQEEGASSERFIPSFDLSGIPRRENSD
jgi:putative pyruvate formate lyase activating enzyme